MSKVDAIRFTLLECKNWAEMVVPVAMHQKTPKIILRHGLCFEAPDLRWWEVDAIHFKHVYNPAHLHIEREDIVVDIGANIGLFTVYAASRTQNTVYAFEPSTSNFQCLKQNIRANRLNNVIPQRLAVSDKNGIELLFESEDRTFRRLKSFAPAVAEKYIDVPEKYIEVTCTTLQDIMDSNNIEQIDFLKLDCEGAEELILESTPKNYLKRVRKIALEYHDNLTEINHQDMRILLQEAGFTVNVKCEDETPYGYLYGWRD